MAENNQSLADTAVIDELRGVLEGRIESISSEDTGVDRSINKAIRSIREGGEAARTAINIESGREIEFAEQSAATQLQGSLEQRRGFGTQMVAFRQFVETTDKHLKDLEQRRQQLLAENFAQEAQQVASLEVQRLQFQEQAFQNTVSNLLGIGNLQVQERQAQQAENRLAFEQRQAKAEISARYGISALPGETLDDMVARASQNIDPNSPAGLELEALRTEIQRNRADTLRIQNEAARGSDLSSEDIDILAEAYRTVGPAILGNVEDATMQARVISKAGELEKQDIKLQIEDIKSTGVKKRFATNNFPGFEDMSATEQQVVLDQIEAVYGEEEPEPELPKNKLVGGFVGRFIDRQRELTRQAAERRANQ